MLGCLQDDLQVCSSVLCVPEPAWLDGYWRSCCFQFQGVSILFCKVELRGLLKITSFPMCFSWGPVGIQYLGSPTLWPLTFLSEPLSSLAPGYKYLEVISLLYPTWSAERRQDVAFAQPRFRSIFRIRG